MHPFTLKIGGEAGHGIMSTGLLFARIASRSGYYTFDYTEYPSIIRGGHNVMQVGFADKVIRAPYQHTNFLIAMNQETVDLHKDELVEGAGILFDSELKIDCRAVQGCKIFPVPMSQLSREIGKSSRMRDVAALAATLALLGGDLELLKQEIVDEFAHKSAKIVEQNHAVADAAYEYAFKHHAHEAVHVLTRKKKVQEQLVLTGNEAIALGAIAGGLQFAAIYPMTPTSNILHNLAPHQEEFNFIYKQPEDEISAINMAIGAAHAGARSMVATSGGGFCLMSEAYGLAGLTETPVVIIEGMRGSPATGVPTWTEQGDLRFVMHAHQGDFPRIVLTPGDVEECFHMTMQAFNLAEKYQTPVVVLVDKHVLESHQSVKPFEYSSFKIDRGDITFKQEKDFHRYALSKNGISKRSVAGSGNHFVANSDEHDIDGYSSEDADNRNEQMQKRMQKLVTCEQEDMPEPVLYGPKTADVTLVSWGSNKGSILDALERIDKVNYLHLTWAHPFPSKAVEKILKKAKKIVNVECNYSAQMHGVIKQFTGIDIDNSLLKYDGRPIYPEEIIEYVESL